MWNNNEEQHEYQSEWDSLTEFNSKLINILKNHPSTYGPYEVKILQDLTTAIQLANERHRRYIHQENMKAWQITSALFRQNDYIPDKVKTTKITENLIDKVEKALQTANSKERKPTSRDGSEVNRTTQQFNHTMTSNS